MIFVSGCISQTNQETILIDTNSTNIQTGDTTIKAEFADNKQNVTKYTDRLKGIWTNGSSENGTFDISNDSIYYVDQFTSYKYELFDDTIKIKYPDWTFVGHLNFSGDTLTIESEDGVTKYWKFKK